MWHARRERRWRVGAGLPPPQDQRGRKHHPEWRGGKKHRSRPAAPPPLCVLAETSLRRPYQLVVMLTMCATSVISTNSEPHVTVNALVIISDQVAENPRHFPCI